MEEEVKYEKIFNGIGSAKVKVAQKFKENFDILDNMKKWNNSKEEPVYIYGTMWLVYIMSAVYSELEIYYYYHYYALPCFLVNH